MILLSPYSAALPNGKQNAKNYPWWPQVINQLTAAGKTVVQVGVKGEAQLTADFRTNLPLFELGKLIQEAETWASVDNFFPHLAVSTGKAGVVVWGKSDPELFGYKLNRNLLKGRKYLRERQFFWWHDETHDNNVFVAPEEVSAAILQLCQRSKPKALVKNTRISCLMVTKNRLPFVQRSVKMFLAQNYPKKELVVVDASDDASTKDWLLQQNLPLKYQAVAANSSVGTMRNQAVTIASGDFLALWDDDDWFHPTRLSTQFNELITTGKDFNIINQWVLRSAQGMVIYSKPLEGSMLIRKEKMVPYPEWNQQEDAALILRLYLCRTSICLTSKPTLYVYEVHGGNQSSPELFRNLLARKQQHRPLTTEEEKTVQSIINLAG